MSLQALGPSLLQAVILIVILLFSLSVHEAAHGAVAYLFGDDTAKRFGRLTLNPLAHWDRVGTTLLAGLILLNAFGIAVPVIGWGKPVPVDESKMDNPRFQGLQVALAGPMSNFILAAIIALIARFIPMPAWLSSALALAVFINLFLMFFNLLPIPPLDGSRILRLFISDEAYYRLASNPILFFVIFFVVIYYLAAPLQTLTSHLAGFLLGG
ncbi:MAG TPA: site-2 protease family protein [Candidatus Saccharimonadales bacterium]|nr:site-2 protease family protein [Candidatus Saccharimonadales bacterium]